MNDVGPTEKSEQVGITVEPRNLLLERILWGILIVLLAGVATASAWLMRSDKKRNEPALPAPTTELAEPRPVPDFSLIDQNGNPVTLDDLKGNVWIADFFFTHCPAQCPMITQRMGQIHKALPDDAPARLVSITVDPEQDSPEVLAEYAKKFGADDRRWLFLTGDKQAIVKLCKEGFQLQIDDMDPNKHTLRLTLVDQEGRIRGYFNALDESELTLLQRRLNQLLESPR